MNSVGQVSVSKCTCIGVSSHLKCLYSEGEIRRIKDLVSIHMTATSLSPEG